MCFSRRLVALQACVSLLRGQQVMDMYVQFAELDESFSLHNVHGGHCGMAAFGSPA
jgi:hypothetical protein